MISSRGSLDLENVVEELSEDELELDDGLDDDELDEEDDICRLLVEMMVSSGSLSGLLGTSLGDETSCAAFGRGSAAGGTMMAASFSCWISSGGEQTVSVACFVGGSSLPASPLLPGLSVKETLFFLYKMEGGSTHMVLFALWVSGYISVFYFLNKWFHMLRPRFLEFQKFFLLFLCVRARSPLYYTNFVILTGVLLIFPIKDFETFCTHEAKS